jgi:hypothetical protein
MRLIRRTAHPPQEWNNDTTKLYTKQKNNIFLFEETLFFIYRKGAAK